MGKSTRKIKRKAEKDKEKELKSKLSEKMGMFDRLPSKCGACEKEYDRKNRDMAFSWRVVVIEDSVKLFCPACWETEEKNGSQRSQ